MRALMHFVGETSAGLPLFVLDCCGDDAKRRLSHFVGETPGNVPIFAFSCCGVFTSCECGSQSGSSAVPAIGSSS